MANTVLRFGQQAPSRKNLEVYRDVSMDGRPAVLPETGDAGYFVDRLVNARAVQNSVRHIFEWIPGERVLNPDFGSRLRLLLYEGMVDHNVEAIMAEIQRCFTEWEPRAVLKNVVHVKSLDDAEHNTIRLDVYYTIKGLDQEQYVYSYTYAAGSD